MYMYRYIDIFSCINVQMFFFSSDPVGGLQDLLMTDATLLALYRGKTREVDGKVWKAEVCQDKTLGGGVSFSFPMC